MFRRSPRNSREIFRIRECTVETVDAVRACDTSTAFPFQGLAGTGSRAGGPRHVWTRFVVICYTPSRVSGVAQSILAQGREIELIHTGQKSALAVSRWVKASEPHGHSSMASQRKSPTRIVALAMAGAGVLALATNPGVVRDVRD